MPPMKFLGKHPLSQAFRLMSALLLVAMLAYGVYAWFLAKERTLEQLLHLSDFTAKASEQFFDHYDVALSLLGQDLQEHQAIQNPAYTHRLLIRFQQSHPDLAAVNVGDPSGNIILSSRVPVGISLPRPQQPRYFWDFFRKAQQRKGLQIAPPIKGTILKQWVIPLLYPVRDAQGRVQYVLVATVLLKNQQAIWRHLELPNDTAIGLIRHDNYLQSRWPDLGIPEDMYQRPKKGPLTAALEKTPRQIRGTYIGLADIKNTYRFGAFSRLPHYPMAAFVSMPIGNVWKDWFHLIRLPFLLFGLLILGGFFIYRLSLRREANLEAARQEAQNALLHLSQQDALTKLPNRSYFQAQLRDAMARAERHERLLGVLFLDLDRFKVINDSLGHAHGDQLIQAVAQRLQASTRQSETVARMGGDEFTLLLEDLSTIEEATIAAQRILDCFRDPFEVDGRELFMSTSIGITIYPFDSENEQILLKNADTAMYRAKELGRNNLQFYAAEMNTRADNRLQLENRLRRALERGEYVLHYQPKLDLHSGAIFGVEALLRWESPEIGLISPQDFIPILEETGLILSVGDWVLQSACRQAAAWQRMGFPLRVAVNLSARQFQQDDLARHINNILCASGLAADLLALEITESMVMANPGQVVNTLKQLKAMGISLAMDDFGTGYSSLAYLKNFPLDSLKIDRSFIHELPLNTQDAAIAKTIIALAHNLNLQVIAEGVEHTAQAEFLRAHGCDAIQGYLVSRPVPAQQISALLENMVLQHSGFS